MTDVVRAAKGGGKFESFKDVQDDYMSKLSPPKRRFSGLKKQMDESLSKSILPNPFARPLMLTSARISEFQFEFKIRYPILYFAIFVLTYCISPLIDYVLACLFGFSKI